MALPAFILLSLFSLSPVESALRELDREIEKRDEYVQRFEASNDNLRADFSLAGSDSLRWEAAKRLFDSYIHFSADSAARYVTVMERYASCGRQSLQTDLEKIRLLVWSHNESRALEYLRSLDREAVDRCGLRRNYLLRAIDIYRNITRYPGYLDEPMNYPDSLESCRLAYMALDGESYEGRKIMAQYLRDDGRYDEATGIFLDCLERYGDDLQIRLSALYNLAGICGLQGKRDERKIYLARSAVCDIKVANMDWLSMYELALELFRDADMKRADRYIKCHFDDVYSGGFTAKIVQSSVALNDIVNTALKVERSRRNILSFSLVLVTLFSLLIFYMWRVARRRGRMLNTVNHELQNVNKALEDANAIKDGYVFRYMDLSVKYLDKIGEQRSDLRKLAKTDGVEAVMHELRQPAEQYADYKDFYAVFDQTFLGIFPGFIEQVNALLIPDVRFDVSEARKSFPTELRILAAIKLGMDDSPRIASFLKCSLSTVYTYRAKLRNRCMCPKEEFENRIKLIK